MKAFLQANPDILPFVIAGFLALGSALLTSAYRFFGSDDFAAKHPKLEPVVKLFESIFPSPADAIKALSQILSMLAGRFAMAIVVIAIALSGCAFWKKDVQPVLKVVLDDVALACLAARPLIETNKIAMAACGIDLALEPLVAEARAALALKAGMCAPPASSAPSPAASSR